MADQNSASGVLQPATTNIQPNLPASHPEQTQIGQAPKSQYKVIFAIVFTLIGLILAGIISFIIVRNFYPESSTLNKDDQTDSGQYLFPLDESYVQSARTTYILDAVVKDIVKAGDQTELKTDLQEKNPEIQKFIIDSKTQFYALGQNAKFSINGQVIPGKEYYAKAKLTDLKQYQQIRITISKGLKSGVIKLDRINIMHKLNRNATTANQQATSSSQIVVP